MVNSLVTSSPTKKKKNVIRPSLTKSRTVSSVCMWPKFSPTPVFQNIEYVWPHGEFAHMIAATVKASSNAAAMFAPSWCAPLRGRDSERPHGMLREHSDQIGPVDSA